MSLFDLFGQDPCADWGEQRTIDVVLDLRKLSLCGVRLGAPAQELSLFGRPSNRRPFRNGQFEYAKIGFIAEAEDNKVSYFGVPVVRQAPDAVGPCCSLTFIGPNGASVLVGNSTPAQALLRELPKPREVDADDEETVYFFHIGRAEFEIEASPLGMIRRVNLYPREE